jgi:hypothetical protein
MPRPEVKRGAPDWTRLGVLLARVVAALKPAREGKS